MEQNNFRRSALGAEEDIASAKVARSRWQVVFPGPTSKQEHEEHD